MAKSDVRVSIFILGEVVHAEVSDACDRPALLDRLHRAIAFLEEGANEVILFETLYAQSNRSISFMDRHLQVGGTPAAAPVPCSQAPAAPTGFKAHSTRGWYAENGHEHLVGAVGTMDVDACAEACVGSEDHCGAFHVYMPSGCNKGDCYIHTLPLGGFVPGNPAAFAYDREHVP